MREAFSQRKREKRERERVWKRECVCVLEWKREWDREWKRERERTSLIIRCVHRAEIMTVRVNPSTFKVHKSLSSIFENWDTSKKVVLQRPCIEVDSDKYLLRQCVHVYQIFLLKVYKVGITILKQRHLKSLFSLFYHLLNSEKKFHQGELRMKRKILFPQQRQKT